MIELKFDSINHKQAGKTVCKVLRFKRCFWFSSNLNFNYASPNFIQDGIGKSDSQQIDSVRLNWKKMGVTLPTELVHYIINTNTTGSRIEIIAAQLELE